MFDSKSVLVALDGSATSETMLHFLVQIAGPLDMKVVLLQVVEPLTPVISDDMYRPVLDDVEARQRDSEKYLEPIAAGLRARGVDATWEVRRGRPEDQILAAAAERPVDMIAMTTHGRSGVGRLLFGSVAEAVLRRATIPVLLLRQPRVAAHEKGAA